MLVEVIMKYIKVPAFIVNSLYDTWALEEIIGFKCIRGHSLANCSEAEKRLMESYKTNLTQVFSQFSGTTITGVWAPACLHASILNTTLAVSQNYRVPEGSQWSAANAIGKWLQDPTTPLIHIDQVSWPSNHACST